MARNPIVESPKFGGNPYGISLRKRENITSLTNNVEGQHRAKMNNRQLLIGVISNA